MSFTASRRTTSVIAALTAVPLFVALAGCATASSDAGSGDSGSSDNETVKVGVVGKGDAQWAPFVEAAAEECITVELVDFGSYEQPNPALTEG